MDTPAFVINLDRDVDKLQATAARLQAVGINFERIPAVDGRLLTEEQRTTACSASCATFCPPAAVGCFLSHRKAWQTIVDRGIPAAFVFEDDVAFHDDAADLITYSMAELPDDYHINLLGCFTCQQEMVVESIIGAIRGVDSARPYSKHLRVPSQTFGSQAYLVSRSGAVTLLALLDKMTATVDWQIGDAMKKGLQLYSTTPDATFQADMHQSSISTKAPAVLNTVMQHVPADRYRSIGWVLSVPLLSFAGMTFSAWCMLFGALAALWPSGALVLLLVDGAIGSTLMSTKLENYLPLFLCALLGFVGTSFVHT